MKGVLYIWGAVQTMDEKSCKDGAFCLEDLDRMR